MARKNSKTKKKIKGGIWPFSMCTGSKCVNVEIPKSRVNIAFQERYTPSQFIASRPSPTRRNSSRSLAAVVRNPLQLTGRKYSPRSTTGSNSSRLPSSVGIRTSPQPATISRSQTPTTGRKSSRLSSTTDVVNSLTTSILPESIPICNIEKIKVNDPYLTEYTVIGPNEYTSYARNIKYIKYLLIKHRITKEIYCADATDDIYITRNGKKYEYTDFIFYINTAGQEEINREQEEINREQEEEERKLLRLKTQLTSEEAYRAKSLGFDRNFIVPKIRYLTEKEELDELEYDILLENSVIKPEQYRLIKRSIQYGMQEYRDENVYINIAKEKAKLLAKKIITFEEADQLRVYGIPDGIDIRPKLMHYRENKIDPDTYSSLKKYGLNNGYKRIKREITRPLKIYKRDLVPNSDGKYYVIEYVLE